MPSLAAEEPKLGTDVALAARVEGWVQYCEYFHLLDADMQRTSEVSAERYSDSWTWGEECDGRVRATDHEKCFGEIEAKCLGGDRPLIRLEDGSEGALIIDDGSGTEGGQRVLRDADLAMVRSKLRAAAHSSNLRVAAEEQAGGHGEEAPLALGAFALAQRKYRARSSASSDPSTCAAAIETLLWFGLALGENGTRGAGGGEGGRGECCKGSEGGKGKGRVPLAELFCGALDDRGALDDLSLDFSQAMREAGLTDEHAADEALAAVRALQQRNEEAAWVVGLGSVDLGRASQVALRLAEATVNSAAANSAAAALDAAAMGQMMYDRGSDGGEEGEEEEEGVREALEIGRFDLTSTVGTEGAALDHEAEGKSSAGDSPERKSLRFKSRGSARPARSPRRWLRGGSSPMLQWEKKPRHEGGHSPSGCSASRKRRGAAYAAGAVQFAPPCMDELGERCPDTCSDSSSESGSQMGSRSSSTADCADCGASCGASDPGDEKPLRQQLSPKRQHVSC